MSATIRTIVVGVSARHERDPHLAAAVAFAERCGATLHVVHAFLLPELLARGLPGETSDQGALLDGARNAVIHSIDAEVKALSPGERVIHHAVEGPAAQVLLDVADEVDAQLIVVGATAAGRLAQAALGTTAQRVVRAAKVPVLVHRQLNGRTPDRILLTTDLSAANRYALERAINVIDALWPSDATQLRVLFVAGDDVLLPPPIHQQMLRDDAEAQLDLFIASLKPARRRLEPRVRLGIAARQIVVDAAEWPADLLVLGTQGRRGFSRFLIGSVAESAMRSAHCDLLVLPVTEPAVTDG